MCVRRQPGRSSRLCLTEYRPQRRSWSTHCGSPRWMSFGTEVPRASGMDPWQRLGPPTDRPEIDVNCDVGSDRRVDPLRSRHRTLVEIREPAGEAAARNTGPHPACQVRELPLYQSSWQEIGRTSLSFAVCRTSASSWRTWSYLTYLDARPEGVTPRSPIQGPWPKRNLSALAAPDLPNRDGARRDPGLHRR